MATVQLRPGDTLNLVMPSGVVRGAINYEVVAPFMYEDLVEFLVPKSRRKNAAKPGGRISRQINLFCTALQKGIWTTGAPINRHIIASKLTDLLADWVDSKTNEPLSVKAIAALRKLKQYDDGGLGADLAMSINLILDRYDA